MINLAVVWDISPEITRLFGVFPLRYYSLLFAGGLMLGYLVVKNIYKKEGLPMEQLDKLAFYVFIATILGARLGHCLFYEPEYYLRHPLEMILPFQITNGDFKFTGFQGLASHGGILGVFIAIYLFSRKTKIHFFKILDMVSIGGALTGAFIRLGNLMNSEIIGLPTGSNYGFIFKSVDNIPRHPAQLYESIAYFLIFILLFILYKIPTYKKKTGLIFGIFFTLLFIARFLIEFVKENQVNFEDDMAINMGQALSIPFILLGVGIMIWKWKTGEQKPKKKNNTFSYK